MRRCILLCALVLAVALSAAGSDARAPTAGAADRAVYRLPRDTAPEHLALGGDGAVWMTEEFGGLRRLQADGRTKEFPESDEDDSGSDVAVADDGVVWGAAFGEVQRIAPGSELDWSVAGNVRAITTAGVTAWATREDPAGILRVNADGPGRFFRIRSPRYPDFGGIAAAPDGSLWFTETDFRTVWVGRMTAGGRYSRWRVPGKLVEGGRITAGPDGAMWFTEPHAIGRISADGQITSFPLAGAAVPHDIVAGSDGNLWFTSDICLERMTPAGQMTSWPVPGALKLIGLAVAGDGSVWLADREANVVRHFDPSAVAPALCGAPTLTRRAGATVAMLSFERVSSGGGSDYFGDIRIHIARHGQEVFHETVPPSRRNAAFGDSRSTLTVRDLDGDGEPEVMLLLNGNCSRGCPWTRIYRYDRARNTYVVLRHSWGDGFARPRVRDLDRDGRLEFISEDERFTSFTNGGGPLQIWAYRRGVLHDVTRRYPGRLRRDAGRAWRLYRKNRGRYARLILPVWMGDEYLLGHQGFADRTLEQIAAQGGLRRHYDDYGPRSPWIYVRQLKALLRRAGYAPGMG